MSSPIRTATMIFHGKVAANVLERSHGFMGFHHVDGGLYRFEGEFDPLRTIVQVQVADPWAKEVVFVEVAMCFVHTSENYSCRCPDDGEGCRLTTMTVASPKWQPIVSDFSRDHFYVNTWRAPDAPDGGVTQLGKSARADVDFFIAGMEV